MRILKHILLILVLVVTFLSPTSAVLAQTPDPDIEFFSQTGHYVQGEFKKTYDSTPDSLLIFGYPITEAFLDPVSLHTVQYFQKARFDSISTSQGPMVEIAHLGQLLYPRDGDPRPEMSSSGKCRLFEKTGKSVCHTFLDFYDEHNGQEYFGNPITEFEDEHDTIVQYFENVRLEWHPELPYKEKVVVSDLGRIYFDSHVADPALLRPAITHNLVGGPEKIEAQAYVSNALISNGDVETIYAVVRDQFHQPIPGAAVNVEIDLPDGKVSLYPNMLTNVDGIISLDYPVRSMSLFSLAQIGITAQYQNMDASADTWFRVW
jgi:hypothetical protein